MQNKKAYLRTYIRDETETLLRVLRAYVARAGLAAGSTVDAAARDLLNEVVVEALSHAERFDPDRQAKAWLLGIAANLIRRKQAEYARLQHREPPLSDLLKEILAAPTPTPADLVASQEHVETLLAPLSDRDRRVIHLAVLQGLDHKTIAQELDITPGTARVRLHRALKRLRRAWRTS